MLLSSLLSIEGVRLLPAAPGRGAPPPPQAVRICDVTEDNRTVVPGSLFIARAGRKSDGNAYIPEAIAAGAVAILTDNPDLDLARLPGSVPILHASDVPLVTARIAELFWREPSKQLKVIQVTGTNGKTTITTLIWQMLNHAGVRCGLMGTVLIDDGRSVEPAEMTTPPALEVSRAFASMVEAGCVAVVMEASSHALDQKRLDALQIDIGVFTNLTGDHLDYHKTMDAYASAKAHLFEMLPARSEHRGVAIVNAHDPWSARMVRDTKAEVIACSVKAQSGSGSGGSGGGGGPAIASQASIEILSHTMDGMGIKLDGPWGAIETDVPLIGRYNAMNLIQAAVACWAIGLGREQIASALPELEAPPGRLERVSDRAAPFSVFVDYAHSDDSLANMLAVVAEAIPGRSRPATDVRAAAGGVRRSLASSKLILVFGCGGDRDRTKRPRMGRVGAEMADQVIVTSDNPRTEKPGDIVDQILAGIPAEARPRVEVQIDRARAIRRAIELASAGDVVVIAGKGHETEQILPDGKGGTVRTHFDDRETARAVLKELGASTTEPRPANSRAKKPKPAAPKRRS